MTRCTRCGQWCNDEMTDAAMCEDCLAWLATLPDVTASSQYELWYMGGDVGMDEVPEFAHLFAEPVFYEGPEEADRDDDDDYEGPEVNDDFPMYLEYDGLYGAPDWLVEQSAQEEAMMEAEVFGHEF